MDSKFCSQQLNKKLQHEAAFLQTERLWRMKRSLNLNHLWPKPNQGQNRIFFIIIIICNAFESILAIFQVGTCCPWIKHLLVTPLFFYHHWCRGPFQSTQKKKPWWRTSCSVTNRTKKRAIIWIQLVRLIFQPGQNKKNCSWYRVAFNLQLTAALTVKEHWSSRLSESPGMEKFWGEKNISLSYKLQDKHQNLPAGQFRTFDLLTCSERHKRAK